MQVTTPRVLMIFLAMAVVTGCTPSTTPPTRPHPPASDANIKQLTSDEKAAIGRKIWQNECGGTVDGLTTWNVGEEFPSLGIGHFIWYPKNFNGRFKESWPEFVRYANSRGIRPPSVGQQRHCPWESKKEFQQAFRSREMNELRSWLASNVTLQTDFIIMRSRAALPKILAAAPKSDHPRIIQNYQKVASTPQGTYALIDYVNFKGDGTVTTERYNGKGWGLLQVLANMKNVPAGPAAAQEFAASAKRMLARRIGNSPPVRGEKRWREGWNNRCDTYARPL